LVLFKTKIIKKQKKKLNDSIAALENMNNQFKEEE
jgi:hypothetical protein